MFLMISLSWSHHDSLLIQLLLQVIFTTPHEVSFYDLTKKFYNDK